MVITLILFKASCGTQDFYLVLLWPVVQQLLRDCFTRSERPFSPAPLLATRDAEHIRRDLTRNC